MFPLHFHYEDVSRQDPLLKLNHANVMEVPGSCEIRVVPKAPYDFIIKNGKLAMDIPCGQKFIHIRGFNVTIVTSANTQDETLPLWNEDETLPPWSGFLQKDEGETQ
ncbi:60S ribosomal protein L5, mitochondrial [Glycine soja]|uniref:60S ribosomal protein L5, mitochondrial n=1 Tax=Glycine soja TaxID=3848 RepID=A0A0B2PPX5_GLYSO|nr:60S ribosomal protein L5, mitochondrial [Glycine soja]